jgi:hypothetical protein
VTVYFEDTIDVLGALLALIALVLHSGPGSGLPDALASIADRLAALCYLASALTRRNRALLTNQSVPERYVDRSGRGSETRAGDPRRHHRRGRLPQPRPRCWSPPTSSSRRVAAARRVAAIPQTVRAEVMRELRSSPAST